MSLLGPVPERASRWCPSSIWTLDLRSLACLRICYGLILLLDLASRACDLQAHYTDWGAVPRAEATTFTTHPCYWSFHLMSGHWSFQAVLFLLAALAACAVLVGYQTRRATFLSWALLVSLHSRNPVVLDGGDVYLRCILFWCMFLPWGARWSWDASQSVECHPPRYASLATLGYLLQFSCIYWMAAALKTGAEWRVDGSAVYYAMHLDQFTSCLAPLLLAHPQLMKFLTFATLAFEAVGPVLLWVPGRIRLLGFAGFFLLHLSFGCFMYLGLFATIGALSGIGFVPGQFWDRLEDRFGVAEKPTGARVPKPHPLTSLFLAMIMIMTVLWNFNTVPGIQMPFTPPSRVLQFLRLDQKWTMFAPRPLIEDGWYVVEAEQRDGRKIDPLRGGVPVDWTKPKGEFLHYRNARWRKLLMNLWDASLVDWRQPFGRYLTRSWNQNHPHDQQILRFRIYFMLEKTLPNGIAPVERKQIWYHRCFDNID